MLFAVPQHQHPGLVPEFGCRGWLWVLSSLLSHLPSAGQECRSRREAGHATSHHRHPIRRSRSLRGFSSQLSYWNHQVWHQSINESSFNDSSSVFPTAVLQAPVIECSILTPTTDRWPSTHPLLHRWAWHFSWLINRLFILISVRSSLRRPRQTWVCWPTTLWSILQRMEDCPLSPLSHLTFRITTMTMGSTCLRPSPLTSTPPPREMRASHPSPTLSSSCRPSPTPTTSSSLCPASTPTSPRTILTTGQPTRAGRTPSGTTSASTDTLSRCPGPRRSRARDHSGELTLAARSS